MDRTINNSFTYSIYIPLCTNKTAFSSDQLQHTIQIMAISVNKNTDDEFHTVKAIPVEPQDIICASELKMYEYASSTHRFVVEPHCIAYFYC